MENDRILGMCVSCVKGMGSLRTGKRGMTIPDVDKCRRFRILRCKYILDLWNVTPHEKTLQAMRGLFIYRMLQACYGRNLCVDIRILPRIIIRKEF